MTPPNGTPTGLFIVVEGPNDSGKSSLIKEMEAYFHALNRKVKVVREPGGSPLGEALRPILKNKEIPIGAFAGALLFNAGRRENVDGIIKPQIEDGTILIFDRYLASTEVFQVALATDLTATEKQLITEILALMPVPDLEIFLQPTAEIIEFRTQAESTQSVRTEVDRFEGQKRELECYIKVSKEHAARSPCIIVPIEMRDNGKPILPKFIGALDDLMGGKNPRRLKIRYINWRGHIGVRHVEPIELVWGKSPYHPGECWILKARDLEAGGKIKDFSLADADFLNGRSWPALKATQDAAK